MAKLETLRRLSLLTAVMMAVAGPLAACGDNDTTAENTGEVEEDATGTGTTTTTNTTTGTTGTTTDTGTTGTTGTTGATGETTEETTGTTGGTTGTTTAQ